MRASRPSPPFAFDFPLTGRSATINPSFSMSSPSPVQASTSASSLDNIPRETAEPSQARHVPEPPKNRKTSSFKAKQVGRLGLVFPLSGQHS